MYSIDWVGNNVIVRMKEEVSFHDINTVDGLLYGDPRYEKMTFQIFDLTAVDVFNVTEQEMQVIGVLDKNSSLWNKKMKVALVSKKESIIKLIGTYIEVMQSTEWKVQIFPNLDEAEKWCNSLALNDLS